MLESIVCAESKHLLQSYADTYWFSDFQFGALTMKETIVFFSKSMIHALDLRFVSSYYYEIKQLEFFHFMNKSYTKEELALYFFPLIGKDLDFKNLVLSSYKKTDSLDDLVKFCCMSKSAFRKQFTAHFGISVYQWILQQRCKRISYLSTFPNATMQRIMDELNFDSPSHFNRFFANTSTVTKRFD